MLWFSSIISQADRFSFGLDLPLSPFYPDPLFLKFGDDPKIRLGRKREKYPVFCASLSPISVSIIFCSSMFPLAISANCSFFVGILSFVIPLLCILRRAESREPIKLLLPIVRGWEGSGLAGITQNVFPGVNPISPRLFLRRKLSITKIYNYLRLCLVNLI